MLTRLSGFAFLTADVGIVLSNVASRPRRSAASAKRYRSVNCAGLSIRWESKTLLLRIDNRSGQNSWSVCDTNVVRWRINSVIGNRVSLLYAGFDIIRTTPFSVRGQLAHPCLRLADHHVCARSWKTWFGSRSAMQTFTSNRARTQTPSSSINRRIFSTVITSLRRGRTGMPFRFFNLCGREPPRPTDNPFRASSEITAPAVFPSCRASSFVAAKTSLSMSSVVRIHLMLRHQFIRCKPGATPTLRCASPPGGFS